MNIAVGRSDPSENWTFYSSAMRSRVGIWEAWKSLIDQVHKNHFLVRQLFVRDFKAQYQQSVLGILWSIILPLIPVMVYVFMKSIAVLEPGLTKIPYVLFVVVGMTVWKVFADGIMISVTKMVELKPILIKVRIPKTVVILAGMGRVCFDTLVRVGLIGVLMVVLGVYPSLWAVLLLLGALIPLISLTLAIGMITSIFNIVFRDVQKAVQAGLTYAVFVSSVVFLMPEEGLIGKINCLNPMNTFVNGLRDILFWGVPSSPGLFVVTSVLSVLLLIVAGRFFYIVEHVVDDKL